MNNSSWVVVIIIILVAGGFGWWWYTQAPAGTAPAGQTDGIGNGVGVGVGVGVGEPVSVGVIYSQSGFSPAEITVKKGDTVTWSNSGGGNMWVASAQHPTHTVYSGIALSAHCPGMTASAFDQCQNGATYSFKFDKVGTWAYHNHTNSGHFGRVIVIE